MIIKIYPTDESACTLESDDIGTHSDGWTIEGEIMDDYYEWVNEFSARHPKFGKVWGDFEEVVYADTEKGYQDFIKHHPPTCWTYGDI